MAQKCAICGAEINLFQQQKLADGNFICRKTCRNNGFKLYDYVHGNLRDVIAMNAQIERGTKLWEHFFVPRRKTKEKEKKLYDLYPIYVSPDTGLMALTETRYKFFLFGKSVRAIVYRIADLYGYECEKETTVVEGKEQNTYYIHYFFRNTEGLYDFRLKQSNNAVANSAIKYFNTLFGVQRTLGNAANTWKAQTEAIKSGAAAVKAVISGDADVEGKASDAFDAVENAEYGDRTEWIRKAEEALNSYTV